MFKNNQNKNLMRLKKLKYCKELDKYILEGYGVYLTDCNIVDLESTLKSFDTLDYEIKFGPTVGEISLSSVGLYCNNYINVLCKRDSFKDDLDGLVKRIVNISILIDRRKDENLNKIMFEEIDVLKGFINDLDLNDYYKIISDLNDICNCTNDLSGTTLDDIKLDLSNGFYDKLIQGLYKDVDNMVVSSLVFEAKKLANDLSFTRKYPFLTVWSPSIIEDSAKEITSFVERVKKENTTGEISGLLNGLKNDDKTYIDGSEYMVLVLGSTLKEKALEEFLNKGKTKEKSK